MSDLPMKQEDHPAHNVPDATKQYAGDVLPIVPIGTPGTWTDLSSNSGAGPKVPTDKERQDRGDPVKRSGYPR